MRQIFIDADLNSDGYVDYREVFFYSSLQTNELLFSFQFTKMYNATAQETVENNVAELLSQEKITLRDKSRSKSTEDDDNATLQQSSTTIRLNESGRLEIKANEIHVVFCLRRFNESTERSRRVCAFG